MVSQIHVYNTELQLTKAHSFDTVAFFGLGCVHKNGIVSSKIYGKEMILIMK